jgi:hypothetical protein
LFATQALSDIAESRQHFLVAITAHLDTFHNSVRKAHIRYKLILIDHRLKGLPILGINIADQFLIVRYFLIPTNSTVTEIIISVMPTISYTGWPKNLNKPTPPKKTPK